jgi:hypothetical protein
MVERHPMITICHKFPVNFLLAVIDAFDKGPGLWKRPAEG